MEKPSGSLIAGDNILQKPPLTLDHFPVPWAQQLVHLVGKGTVEIPSEVQRLDNLRLLGITSSRQAKFGFAEQDWQAALQASLHLAHQQGWVVLIASDTPYFQAIEHACSRMKVAWMSLVVSNGNGNISSSSSHSTATAENKVLHYLGAIHFVPESPEAFQPGPSIQDRAIAFLSDHLFALSVRRGGAIEALLHQRLKTPEIPPGSTYITIQAAIGSKPIASQVQRRLIDAGAVGWIIPSPSTETEANEVSAAIPRIQLDEFIEDISQYRNRTTGTSQLLIRLPTLRKNSDRKYLIHFTRARRGPWPDQSLSQFHDEIMHQPWTDKPSALATLIRILEQQRLIGTTDLRRSQQETVCFSQRPIDELPSMRRFQSHLGRWDWEPYGLMIDLDWMIEQGAKPVQYISPEEAKHREADSLVYCQVVSSHGGKHDWTQEQEWRVAGDLRLHRVPFEKCFVFVPNDSEAKKIQRLSRWPILSLDQAGD